MRFEEKKSEIYDHSSRMANRADISISDRGVHTLCSQLRFDRNDERAGSKIETICKRLAAHNAYNRCTDLT